MHRHRLTNVAIIAIRRCIRIVLQCTIPIAACVMFFPACGVPNDAESEKSLPTERPELVGRVASVPPGKAFLLIEAYGEWNVADGAVLVARGDGGRTANLLVTGERLGQFAAADIQAGLAQVGDAVFRLPVLPSGEVPTPAPGEAAGG